MVTVRASLRMLLVVLISFLFSAVGLVLPQPRPVSTASSYYSVSVAFAADTRTTEDPISTLLIERDRSASVKGAKSESYSNVLVEIIKGLPLGVRVIAVDFGTTGELRANRVLNSEADRKTLIDLVSSSIASQPFTNFKCGFEAGELNLRKANANPLYTIILVLSDGTLSEAPGAPKVQMQDALEQSFPHENWTNRYWFPTGSKNIPPVTIENLSRINSSIKELPGKVFLLTNNIKEKAAKDAKLKQQALDRKQKQRDHAMKAAPKKAANNHLSVSPAVLLGASLIALLFLIALYKLIRRKRGNGGVQTATNKQAIKVEIEIRKAGVLTKSVVAKLYQNVPLTVSARDTAKLKVEELKPFGFELLWTGNRLKIKNESSSSIAIGTHDKIKKGKSFTFEKLSKDGQIITLEQNLKCVLREKRVSAPTETEVRAGKPIEEMLA